MPACLLHNVEKNMCVNLYNLYPITEVPVPRNGDKRRERRIAEENDNNERKKKKKKKNKNLSRFCRSYPSRAGGRQTCLKDLDFANCHVLNNNTQIIILRMNKARCISESLIIENRFVCI